jgi:hypothetical protein
MALDGSGTPTMVNEVPFNGRTLWSLGGHDADASTAIEIVAAPGFEKSLYLFSVLLQSDDADAHPKLQDEDGNLIFIRLNSTVEGVAIEHTFVHPLKLTSNKALQLKAAAAGNVSVWVEGATADD